MPEILSQTESAPSSAPAVDAFFAQVIGLAKAAREYSFGAHRLDGIPGGIAAVLQLLLQKGPLSVPSIGRARSTSRQNTQILVNRMVTERWVDLVSNPAHKRSALVQLTEEGRRLAKSATERESELHQLVSTRFSVADLQQATDLLVRIREVISHQGRELIEDHPVSSRPPELHEQPVNLP